MTWLVLAGGVFFVMGLILAGDAEHYAKAAAEWDRLARPAASARQAKRERKRLVLAYRIAGGVFSAAGLALALGAIARPDLLERLRRLLAVLRV